MSKKLKEFEENIKKSVRRAVISISMESIAAVLFILTHHYYLSGFFMSCGVILAIMNYRYYIFATKTLNEMKLFEAEIAMDYGVNNHE